jgi:hypothetical protein
MLLAKLALPTFEVLNKVAVTQVFTKIEILSEYCSLKKKINIFNNKTKISELLLDLC